MRGPLASVVIPVYNGERFLSEAVESVLSQDYEPVEVIVVDDGSTDRTPSIARSFEGLVYISQPNRGPSAARNIGIARARGEFVAFLDHDDTMPPAALSVRVVHLLEHPNVGCTLGNMETFFEPGSSHPHWLPTTAGPSPAPVSCSSLVARRSAIERVGGFDETFRFGEDQDWLIRAREAGIEIAILPEVVLRRRIHDANMSHDNRESARWILRSIRAHRDRVRNHPDPERGE
jgi:glycosyltransferase involved in cell wall biosynthesis